MNSKTANCVWKTPVGRLDTSFQKDPCQLLIIPFLRSDNTIWLELSSRRASNHFTTHSAPPSRTNGSPPWSNVVWFPLCPNTSSLTCFFSQTPNHKQQRWKTPLIALRTASAVWNIIYRVKPQRQVFTTGTVRLTFLQQILIIKPIIKKNCADLLHTAGRVFGRSFILNRSSFIYLLNINKVCNFNFNL